jgi:threonine synthase
LQVSFEDAVLKGLASDNGLFIPEEIPALPANWTNDWANLSFEGLAFEILSLYISPTEIPHDALKDIIRRSYSTFRLPVVTPTVTLDAKRNIHFLELFHGETFAFKDIALQFLGNLLEFFLERRNRQKASQNREHLTVIGATSGDTGSAGIYGLRGKKDISIFIMYPTGRISVSLHYLRHFSPLTSVANPRISNDDCPRCERYESGSILIFQQLI